MYIELTGEGHRIEWARIRRVSFSKTGRGAPDGRSLDIARICAKREGTRDYSHAMKSLTKPTRGRLTLWLILALLWLLFLPQALWPPTTARVHVSVGGVMFWAVVQLGLLWLTWMTWRRRRSSVIRSSGN
jgi:hypothetical protein